MEKNENLIKNFWVVATLVAYGKQSAEELKKRWCENPPTNTNLTTAYLTRLTKVFNNIWSCYGLMIEITRSKKAYYQIVYDDSDVDSRVVRDFFVRAISLKGIDITPDLSDRIYLEFPKVTRFSRVFLNAMKKKLKLNVSYSSIKTNITLNYLITPYYMSMVRGHIYIVGKKEGCDELRTWALDRFSEVKITDIPYELPKDFVNAKQYFMGCPGIVKDSGIEEIDIKASGSVAKQIALTPLEESQELIPDKLWGDTACSHFRFHTRANLEMKASLLYKGEFVEVLSPKSFRQEMARVALRMAYMYRDSLMEMFGPLSDKTGIKNNPEYMSDLDKFNEIGRLFRTGILKPLYSFTMFQRPESQSLADSDDFPDRPYSHH